MTNDTSTLNGALLEMKDQLISELADKGVTASYDPSTGLLGLIAQISDIQTGGSCYHIEFDESSYEATGGSATISCTLQSNYAPLSGATVTFTGSDSSVYTGITNNSGVASVTVSNLSATTTFTCSYSNVTDTCTVTVPPSLIETNFRTVTINDNNDIPFVYWIVQLDDGYEYVANKTVKLYIDNVLKASGTTNSAGSVTLSSVTTFGTHTIKCVFEGDDTYEGCEISRTATYEGGGDIIDQVLYAQV